MGCAHDGIDDYHPDSGVGWTLIRYGGLFHVQGTVFTDMRRQWWHNHVWRHHWMGGKFR